MRKALVIGIDHYEHSADLNGCVADAYSVSTVLDRHADGSKNFHVKLLSGTGPQDILEKGEIRQAIEELFSGNSEVALLYFAGHGHIDATGGFLCAGDCKSGHDGLALSDIMTFVAKSASRNKILVLDSCHSGALASNAIRSNMAEVPDGVTILTASTSEQYSSEENGKGVFTSLFVDALSGAAANLVGAITPGAVYAHIDQSLGPWAQRPVFKTNVQSFVSLRQVQPPISPDDLRKLPQIFPEAEHEVRLDPSFEPTSEVADKNNTEIFSILQRYAKVNLVRPQGSDHMYFAAMESKSCRLTVLGEHYRDLVVKELI
ncbi:caspase family protein [Brucella anthropi]|uniref:caspase family protein n=1 Tax=Brucella anthropi TaxID=529 RepID=UPI00124D6C01|nr:caspase family protein [Brucella anthropi]KAB2801011.1 caspase family protein [Brucella anthropi]